MSAVACQHSDSEVHQSDVCVGGVPVMIVSMQGKTRWDGLIEIAGVMTGE